MKIILFLTIGLVVTFSFAELEAQWKLFKRKYKKIYKNETVDEYRFSVFVDNWKYIEKHNEDNTTGYTLGINRHGDYLPEEVFHSRHSFDGRRDRGEGFVNDIVAISEVEVPSEFDWRSRGIAPSVTDEGNCSSGWAFSAVEAIEAHLNISKQVQVRLSAQELLDCSQSFGNRGCEGGSMDFAFKYVLEATEGLSTALMYPYNNEKNLECHVPPIQAETTSKVNGYKTIRAGDEQTIRLAIARLGPVAASLSASSRDFLFYKKGIFPGCSCAPKVNHSVLIMGYTPEYWIVKNFWGKEWGEAGYMRLDMATGSVVCGISSAASFPTFI